MLNVRNLIREVKLVPKLSEVLQNVFMYIITVILGLTVGAKAEGNLFLSKTTLIIIMLGRSLCSRHRFRVLMGKLMYYVTKGKVNPMIGAAGVSAVPMAARVVHLEGQKANPHNYLLMYAMGPNVAGVIGSAVAAGVLLAFFQ